MTKSNLWNMTGLDVFFQSLNETDRKKYLEGIENQHYLSPLKSWGLSSTFFTPFDLLEARKKDKDALILLSKQFQWKTDVTEILSKPYEALVLTDAFQNIIWTNPGFYKMTGFTDSFAVGKRPSFLQGDATSTETKLAIRNKLLIGKPFTEKVVNYKKNRQKYWCEVRIFPINTENHKMHYLALETELL